MSEMVEIVARALCKLPGNDPDREPEPGHPLWKEFVPEARAAIEAMKEPTEAIVNDLCIFSYGTEAADKDEARKFWQELIDAALEPAPVRKDPPTER